MHDPTAAAQIGKFGLLCLADFARAWNCAAKVWMVDRHLAA